MRRIILVVVLSMVPALVRAQASPPPAAESTAHRHLGFFLRLDGGVGYLGSSASQGGVDASISGVGIPLGVAVGGAVIENFILAGDFWFASALSPSFEFGGQTATASDSSFSLGGVGLNLTYYFMPANVYVSFTPSIVMASLTVSGISGDTEAGFGGKLGVGKEWWVGDHWGLGLAGQFFFGINKDKGTDPPTWTSLGGGLAFSATYN
jgi:hypothetical protein